MFTFVKQKLFFSIGSLLSNFLKFAAVMVKDIKIEDYTYILPEERIAKYPLLNRDDSKLLVYTSTSRREPVSERFASIADFLPSDGFMVFNNTKVVPARLIFRRPSGAIIEVFCLEPDSPSDYQISFAQNASCRWKAIIGNAKRWKEGSLQLYVGESSDEGSHAPKLELEILREIELSVSLISRVGNVGVVEFCWKGGYTFSKVMEACGRIPIPPYLKRDTQAIDYERYQTYYALKEGSVAAPTAGLHFTQKEFLAIDKRGIERAELCLHVGAGTFMPVKSEHIGDHTMHSEPFDVSLSFLERLLAAVEEGKAVIAVGTTSTRCLESLYFLGVHCIECGEPHTVEQWEPYREEGYSYSLSESLSALIKYLKNNNLEHINSRTGIIIAPGYQYRIIKFLVTNFHQPQSTLLLLIAAFVGDNWKRIYSFALDNGFRFLSYGDSSLLEKE